MANPNAQKARDDFADKQKTVIKQWQTFSRTEAYQDLMDYIDAQREMYRKYAEERVMPSPDQQTTVAIDNETVAALLQNSRGLNIVKTYLQSRIDTQVAPTKKTK